MPSYEEVTKGLKRKKSLAPKHPYENLHLPRGRCTHVDVYRERVFALNGGSCGVQPYKQKY